MHRKLITFVAAIGSLAALSAIASSAMALPEFLPANGKFPVKFTSISGPGTLAVNGGNTIECTADTNKGELLTSTTLTFTVDFTGCKIFGFVGAHSLGDPEGTVLVTANGTICFLNKANKEVAVKLTPTGKVHIEAAGALAIVEGTLIGQLKPVNTKSLAGELVLKERAAGEQELLKCEGGAEEHLTTSENEGTAKASSEVTTDKIGYLTTEVTLDA
jgi:hypothetical protein